MDVSTWLRDLGLEDYAQAFKANHIDAKVLLRLTADDLTALGITSVGHRRRLLDAIAALDQERAPAAAGPIAAAARPVEAERRQLTVLFCDLVGSTELATRLDPEDLREVMRAYQAACAEVVRRFGGHLARFLGDGVLAYFGWPRAHEDDAERAVRAGLELLEAVRQLRLQSEFAPQARVGIATGPVVVGDLISEQAADRDTVIGETPNLAARLQALAEPGSMLISGQTRRLLGGLFELSDFGARELKGFVEPVRAWRVDGKGVAEDRFEALRGRHLSPFVGREREVALLLDCWRQSEVGRGQVVLLSGEPGIGKSRLVEVFRSKLPAESHIYLPYHCSPLHAADPMYPVIRQIERAARLSHDDSSTRRLAKLRALLRLATNQVLNVAPVIAELLAIQLGRQQGQLAPRREMDRKRTLKVLVGLLVELTARKPVLLVAEDAQWIDPTSLELLGRAIDRTKTLSLMVVIIFRPEFVPQWTRSRHVTSLALNGLSRRHAAVLAQHVARGKDLPRDILDRVVAKTSGVPLFVEELTKAAFESGHSIDQHSRASHWDIDLPATLQSALMERLDRLAPVKEIAQTAAVIGREFSHELLAAVSPLAVADLDAALDELVNSELVFRRGASPNATYSFKHALVQDAAYQSLLKSRRQQLHARLVQAIEIEQPETERERGGTRYDYVLIAHHCAEAGLIDKAVRYHRKAAALGVRRYAHMEALTNAKKGLELLEKLPPSPDRRAEALELQRAIAETLAALKGYAAAPTIDAFRKLRELCDTPQDSVQLRNALRILIGFLFARHDWDGARQTAERILLLGARQNDVVAEVMGRRELGVICFARGDNVAARDHLNKAARQHTAHGDSVDFSSCWDPHISSMSYLACALFALGYPEKAIDRCEQAVAAARTSRWDNAIGAALSCRCRLFQAMGDWETVDVVASEMLSRLDEAESEWRTRAEVFRIWALAAAGRTDDKAFSGVSRAEVDLPPYYSGLISQSYAAAGKVEHALRMISEAIERGLREGDREGEAEMYRLKGEWLLSLSEANSDGAEKLFRRAINVAQSQRAKLWELRAANSLARLWVKEGKQERARDLLAPVYRWLCLASQERRGLRSRCIAPTVAGQALDEQIGSAAYT